VGEGELRGEKVSRGRKKEGVVVDDNDYMQKNFNDINSKYVFLKSIKKLNYRIECFFQKMIIGL